MEKLILDGVSKRFGNGDPAVADFSLEVEAGTFLALLGPSGCGKTTILRMIAGFEQPSAGTIRLGQRELAGPGGAIAPERRNMAMVFQSYALWPHMTVAANVGYPLKIRGVRGAEYRERIERALETVHMTGFAERRPHALSGGQRQRVALARCLVSDPDVVLLDEPLANLDRHLRASMEETFREFHARTGATMIYVTHDQAEAMALADRVAVMAKGQLLQADAPEEIYRRPKLRAVADLIGHGFVLRLPIAGQGPGELTRDALTAALDRRRADCGSHDVFVRPEDVVEDPGGALCATVTDCVFKGERYALNLSGNDMVLQCYSADARPPGTKIRCSVLKGWRL